MATKPGRRNSNSSCFSFTACFGISGEFSKPDEQNPSESSKSGGRKKKMSWLSWSRFRNKKSVIKTVPVDSCSKELIKQHKNSGGGVDRKAAIAEMKLTKKVVLDQIENQKAKKVKHGRAHNIILKSSAQIDPLHDTYRKSITQESEPKNSRTQPGSPVHKFTCAHAVVMNPQSLPFNSQKPARVTGSSQPQAKKPASPNNACTGKFGPMTGLSIVLVSLALLLLFGRICAIICTSMWFYAAPRLMAGKSDDSARNGSVTALPDYSSEEYKKRVILEGLLERNHRHANLHSSEQGRKGSN